MKIQANRKLLAEAAKTALVPTTGYLPILNGVRLDAQDDRVRFTGTNLDTTITVEASADVRIAGSVVLPSRILSSFLVAANDEIVTIEVTDEWALVDCGRTQASLRCMRLEDWPKVTIAKGEGYELGSADIERLWAVLHAVARDAKAVQNRPAIGGVHFAENRAEATEGSVFVTAQLGVSDLPDVIVPGDVVSRVVKGSPEGATAVFDDRSVTFTSADGLITWTSTLIVANYPDMVRWLRKESAHSLTIEREALDAAVDRVKVLGDEGDFRPVDLSFEDDLLVLTTRSKDIGTIRDDVPCQSTFDFPMRFHLQFLGLLCDLLGGEEITLEVQEAMKPVIARSEDWRLVVVVGPMQP